MFKSIYDKVKATFPEIKYVVADAGYKIPYICKQILDDRRVPVLPYKRPMSKKGYFKPYKYVYDEYYDCVLCPNDQVLRWSGGVIGVFPEGKRNWDGRTDQLLFATAKLVEHLKVPVVTALLQGAHLSFRAGRESPDAGASSSGSRTP